MTLPTLEKTWQHSANNVIAAQGTPLATNRRILRTLKNLMLAFGSSAWTTRYSSNGTAPGTGSAGDGVDHWAADGDLIWNSAGSAHSWYVFRQAGITATFEFLISLEGVSADGSILTAYISPSATFTGGTSTARPTATDEIPLRTGAVWGGTSSADSGVILNVMMSTDGQCTRVVINDTSLPSTFLMLDKPKNPPAAWTNPCFGVWLGAATGVPTYSDVSGAILHLRLSATVTTAFMTQEAFGTSTTARMLGAAAIGANELTGEFPVLPIGIWCDNSPLRGQQGQIFDFWLGYTSVANGDTYPNDATRQFVQFGVGIHPWNGTIPVIT
jgi:hypothetical protein